MKQRGLVKLEGTSDDVTFYKSKDGYLARRKGGVSKERIKSDPKFARVRENDKEFGSAAGAGKLLRTAIASFMKNAKDYRVVSRLLFLMTRIQKMDATSARGDRNVGAALALATAKALLKGFEFNNKSEMSTILYKPYSIDLASGKIGFNNFVPKDDVTPPAGATHLTLRGAYANINFTDGMSEIAYTNEENLIIDGTASTFDLAPASVPAGTGTKLYFLQIEFFQMVNGVQYELNNGSYSALIIAEVD